MTTLAEALATMPGVDTATTQQKLDWLTAIIDGPRTVSVHEVRDYLTTQINGSGTNQRSVLGLLIEFAEQGTVRGSTTGITAPTARQSGAQMILEMLRHGGELGRFRVDDVNVRAQFVALGPDGGSGANVFTTEQLQALDALATEQMPRWQALGVPGGVVTQNHVEEV